MVDSVVDSMAGHYPCGSSRQCIDGVAGSIVLLAMCRRRWVDSVVAVASVASLWGQLTVSESVANVVDSALKVLTVRWWYMSRQCGEPMGKVDSIRVGVRCRQCIDGVDSALVVLMGRQLVALNVDSNG